MSQHFFVKLIPNRSTFAQDMSAEERAIMQRHAEYWAAHMQRGHVLIFGPVLDPDGVYGVGIVQADSAEEVHAFAAKDPAASINRFEVHPMHAVLPSR